MINEKLFSFKQMLIIEFGIAFFLSVVSLQSCFSVQLTAIFMLSAIFRLLLYYSTGSFK